MSAQFRLPEQAAKKFAALADSAEEAHALVLANQRRIGALEDQQRHLSEDDAENFATLSAEISRISARRNHDNIKYRHRSTLHTAVRTWLQQVPASWELRDVAQHRTLKDRTSESTEEEIELCREDIMRLQQERSLVQRAVPPVEDLYAAAEMHVKALAARGRPTVTVDDGQLKVRHPKGRDDAAVAAWLNPEAMLQRLREQIDEVHAAHVRHNARVMSVAERDGRLAELDAEILQREHEDEFLVEVGESFGLFVTRREDADPRALLGVALHRRERAVA